MDPNFISFFSALATLASAIALIHKIGRDLRTDINSELEKFRLEMKDMRREMKEGFQADRARLEQQENRIFQLAMGKSFKEILLEEKLMEEKLSEKMDDVFSKS